MADFHGPGTYTSSVNTYASKDGTWKNGDMTKGTLVFRDGDQYTGKFRVDANGQDQPWGKGKWTFKNGDFFLGKFKCGMYHGRGKLVEIKNGKTHTTEGQWKNDKFVKSK